MPERPSPATPTPIVEEASRRNFANPATRYVPLTPAPPIADKPVRLIAFYLPQFHAIPENDAWWGEGFTEWTNVKPATPLFEGHYQPREPGELGYYNLDDAETQYRQVELARQYGIEGFCFYFYWFGGKRLLERPVESWLADENLNFPFCLCWANENWSRRWDGQEEDILIAQEHSAEDDIAFISEVSRYMRDPRYIRVNGKPLLLVYRPSLLPSAKETVDRWRNWCRHNGIGEIHLAYTQSFEVTHPEIYGFDAAIEFPPNNSNPPDITKTVKPVTDEFEAIVYDWSIFHQRSENYEKPEYPLYRSVCPGWDNTARLKNRGTVFVNNTPDLYQEWLENAILDTVENTTHRDQRLVFVNAWNEWAEGAYLEPDAANGYAYLQATRNALINTGASSPKHIVVVSHDAHPHGSQLLAMNISKGLTRIGFEVDLIVLGPGPLMQRFEQVARVHQIDMSSTSSEHTLQLLRTLRQSGAEVAIANTTVSGKFTPLLKEAGFYVVSLIHELPGILERYNLGEQARLINRTADSIVFPARIVQDGFEKFVGERASKAKIRPQGSYLLCPYPESEREKIRTDLRRELDLQTTARIMLCTGYGDRRKGLDLFVETAIEVITATEDAAAVWVGHCDSDLHDKQVSRIKKAGLEDRILFPGFLDDPRKYYFAADVFVLTSREDPFPSVVMESLDASVPIVAFSGAGGFTELVARDCGRLVPAFDTSAMAQTIAELFGDPQLRKQLGSTGRSIVDSEFRFPHYIHDLLQIAGKPQPKVSVVIPNYNYARYIVERLNSIATQTIQPYELIVLDDASTDESRQKIEEFLALCEIPSRFVANEENSGSVFRQWRRGVELARGDFVWIAEADDVAKPELLETLLPAFEDDSIVLSYCQSQQIDSNGKVLIDHYLDYVEDIDHLKWRHSHTELGAREISDVLFVKNTIPNVSAVIFRREPLLEVLSKHEQEIASYKVAGDWFAYLRILEQGSIAFSARSLNSHRRHQNSVTIGNFNIQQLGEIVSVQNDIIRRHNLGEDARQKAANYTQSLYEHFGFATASRPRYEDHPELQSCLAARP